MAQISDLVIEKIYAIMVEELQTPFAPADPTYADVVKMGLLQDNPLKNGISVTVHQGDPDEIDQDAWVDEVAKSGDPSVPFTPMFEIGGSVSGLHWWRRGTIKAECFFIKTGEDRDTAREYTGIIRGRIERALAKRAGDFTGLVDEFGERVLLMVPMKSYAREQGGPKQHIWRVYVWWQALTYRS